MSWLSKVFGKKPDAAYQPPGPTINPRDAIPHIFMMPATFIPLIVGIGMNHRDNPDLEEAKQKLQNWIGVFQNRLMAYVSEPDPNKVSEIRFAFANIVRSGSYIEFVTKHDPEIAQDTMAVVLKAREFFDWVCLPHMTVDEIMAAIPDEEQDVAQVEPAEALTAPVAPLRIGSKLADLEEARTDLAAVLESYDLNGSSLELEIAVGGFVTQLEEMHTLLKRAVRAYPFDDTFMESIRDKYGAFEEALRDLLTEAAFKGDGDAPERQGVKAELQPLTDAIIALREMFHLDQSVMNIERILEEHDPITEMIAKLNDESTLKGPLSAFLNLMRNENDQRKWWGSEFRVAATRLEEVLLRLKPRPEPRNDLSVLRRDMSNFAFVVAVIQCDAGDDTAIGDAILSVLGQLVALFAKAGISITIDQLRDGELPGFPEKIASPTTPAVLAAPAKPAIPVEPLPPLRPPSSPSLIEDGFGLDAAKKGLRRFKKQDSELDDAIEEICSSAYALEAATKEVWKPMGNFYGSVELLERRVERVGTALNRLGSISERCRLDLRHETSDMINALFALLEDFSQQCKEHEEASIIPIDSFFEKIDNGRAFNFIPSDHYGLASALGKLKRFSALGQEMKLAIEHVCRAAVLLEDAVITYRPDAPLAETKVIFSSLTDRFSDALASVSKAADGLGIDVDIEKDLIRQALNKAVAAKNIKL